MIKGIILDVDGVILGGKKDYNWPTPNPLIIRALKSLREKGMLISLCTGKGTFSIKSIVELAHLDNVHIGDGGAIVIDFINNKLIAEHIIDSEIVRKTLSILQQHGLYIELYTKDGYFIQKDSVCDKTARHIIVLEKQPNIVNSFEEVASKLEVVKIMLIADNKTDKQRIIDLVGDEIHGLPLQWGVHPSALPYQFGYLTASGISKKQAIHVISEYTKIPLNEMLGIGDGMTDWKFMEDCGFAGVMGNGSPELKTAIVSKGDHGFVGGTVDENGVIDILKYFQVI
jgi:HAD superfamily hydrolase (TIGR01484 family)